MSSEFMDHSAANGVSCAGDYADEAILSIVLARTVNCVCLRGVVTYKLAISTVRGEVLALILLLETHFVLCVVGTKEDMFKLR